MKKKFIPIIILIFALISAGIYALNIFAPLYRTLVLEGCNILLALLSLISFIIISKQLNGRPEAFVRGVSGARFLKLMVCMIAMLVYVLLNRTNLHKPTVFVLMGIYGVYSISETLLLSKIAREQQ